MYNIEIIPSYAYYDKELIPFCPLQINTKTIKENIEEFTSEEEISNSLYKSNLLESFNLTEFDEIIINNEIDKLFSVLKNNDRFKKCMKKVANTYMSEDLCTGLMLLFSYDYFFLTHSCICEYFKTKEMPTMDKLEKYIQKKTER